MGDEVYGTDFGFDLTSFDGVPQENNVMAGLGGHLSGKRIGFDLGGSDAKIAAVIGGKVIESQEIAWDPKLHSDPRYHKTFITEILEIAASWLDYRIDRIGGSAAGIYVNNEARVASLFKMVKEAGNFGHLKGFFNEMGNRYNAPLQVINDGLVTALAGYEWTGKHMGVLGVAMGTSVACGESNALGQISTKLKEGAFMQIDYNPNAPIEDWSKAPGCAASYLCQVGVRRLVPRAGLDGVVDTSLKDAEQLEQVQELAEDGDARAESIYRTIGAWYAHTLPLYMQFSGDDVENVLVLGRVTSGKGGEILIDKAKEVLRTEYPELYEDIKFYKPTEQQKRHGQAIAAAGLLR